MVIELSGHLRDELFQESGPTRDGPQQEPFWHFPVAGGDQWLCILPVDYGDVPAQAGIAGLWGDPCPDNDHIMRVQWQR